MPFAWRFRQREDSSLVTPRPFKVVIGDLDSKFREGWGATGRVRRLVGLPSRCFRRLPKQFAGSSSLQIPEK